jgi:hypothetical protein
VSGFSAGQKIKFEIRFDGIDSAGKPQGKTYAYLVTVTVVH